MDVGSTVGAGSMGGALADTDAALWEVAREAALELPGSELYPFTEDWDAVRVRGKWFLITTDRAPDSVTGRAAGRAATGAATGRAAAGAVPGRTGSGQAELGTAGAAGTAGGGGRGRIVNLKADPEDVRALTEAYPSILPGYHMSKRHWITLRPGADLTAALVRELVTESYLLVVTTLPRARRPVDPARWAARRHG